MYCNAIKPNYKFCTKLLVKNNKYCRYHNIKINCLFDDFNIEELYLQDVIKDVYPIYLPFEVFDEILRINCIKCFYLDIPKYLCKEIYSYLPNEFKIHKPYPHKIFIENIIHFNQINLLHNCNKYTYKKNNISIMYINDTQFCLYSEIFLNPGQYSRYKNIPNFNYIRPIFTLYNLKFFIRLEESRRSILISYANNLNLFKQKSKSIKRWKEENKDKIFVTETFLLKLSKKIIDKINNYKGLIRNIHEMHFKRIIRINNKLSYKFRQNSNELYNLGELCEGNKYNNYNGSEIYIHIKMNNLIELQKRLKIILQENEYFIQNSLLFQLYK